MLLFGSQTVRCHLRSLKTLCSYIFAVLLLGLNEVHAKEESPDRESYYRAVDHCRGVASQSMALNVDQSILCFDGRIEKGMDVSSAANLREGGLFVVRSPGGNIASAIALSDLLRERHATVLVYDQCLWSCANYLLIASDRAYVFKGALVAWDYESSDPAFPSCSRFAMEKTRAGDYRLQRGSCRPPPVDEEQWRTALLAQARFYKERMVDPYFEPPPDNRYLRKAVKSLYPDTSAYHHVGWTLHPRYFAKLFKCKIVYESYPEGQEEVDEMVARLHLDVRVIYDP
jgi:hypothetical protein